MTYEKKRKKFFERVEFIKQKESLEKETDDDTFDNDDLKSSYIINVNELSVLGAKAITFVEELLEENKIKLYQLKDKIFFNRFRNVLFALIRRILDIYLDDKIEEKSLIYSILNTNNNLYLTFLSKNKKYNNAYEIYLKELISLILAFIEEVKYNNIKTYEDIKKILNLSYSISSIKHIKKEFFRIIKEIQKK